MSSNYALRIQDIRSKVSRCTSQVAALHYAIFKESLEGVVAPPFRTVNLPFSSISNCSAINALTATSLMGHRRFVRALSHFKMAGAHKPGDLPNFSKESDSDASLFKYKRHGLTPVWITDYRLQIADYRLRIADWGWSAFVSGYFPARFRGG